MILTILVAVHTPLNPHSNIPAADTARTRSLSSVQGAYSVGSRAAATASTDFHRALLRRRHDSSLNWSALAPVAGSNQSCTADLLASRTTTLPLPPGFLQPTNEVNEHWKRERRKQCQSAIKLRADAACADWRAARCREKFPGKSWLVRISHRV